MHSIFVCTEHFQRFGVAITILEFFFWLLLLFIAKLVFSLSSSQYDQSCTFKCKINWFNCQQTELEQKNDEKVISVVIFCDFANIALFFHFSVRNISFHLLRSFYTFSNFCLYWIIILEFHCTLFIQLETRSQRPQREKHTHTLFCKFIFYKTNQRVECQKGCKVYSCSIFFSKDNIIAAVSFWWVNFYGSFSVTKL